MKLPRQRTPRSAHGRGRHEQSTHAATTPFSLSILTAAKGNASKRLIADTHGKPMKDPSHSLAISTGTLEHAELAGLLALVNCYSG